MNSRERVLRAINRQETDRVPLYILAPLQIGVF